MTRESDIDDWCADEQLYRKVLEHRRKFIGLKGFDYDSLYPKTLSLHIPSEVMQQWRDDYETMRKTMIHGESIPFGQLLDKIQELNEEIRRIPIQI